MNDLYIYIIESGMSLFLLSAIYYLVLKKSVNFLFNRIFILLILLGSFLIPLLDFSFIQNQTLYTFQLAPLEIVSTGIDSRESTLLSISNILLFLYLCGSLFLLFKLIRDFYLIYIIKTTSKILINNYGLRIYLNKHKNFRFFNWIFIHESDEQNEIIIHHEMKHQQMYHSLDIVLLKIVQIVFCFSRE